MSCDGIPQCVRVVCWYKIQTSQSNFQGPDVYQFPRMEESRKVLIESLPAETPA